MGAGSFDPHVSIARDRTGFSASEFPVSDATTSQITSGSGFASILDVLPFSKRAPAPDEYLLRSGDYEASREPQVIPPAPRAPIFARQAQPAPYGFAHHYGQDLHSAPPASRSLAPVAMSAGSTGAMSVGYDTGSHRAQPTVLINEKPSLKWGVLIAITGAMLGGVLGVGMDAKRQQARAAAAAQATENAPVAVAQPAALPPMTTQVVAPKPAVVAQPAAPAVIGASPVAPAVQPVVAAQPAAPVAPAAAGVTLPPQQPVVIAPTNAKQAKAETKPSHAPAPHGFVGHRPPPATHPMVAVKVNPPPAEKAEPKKPEPKPEAAAAPSGKKTDAQKVLEDAIKNTANTL